MLNKLKENIYYLGLSIKKEVIIFVILNLILVGGIAALVIFNMPLAAILLSGAFVLFSDYLYFARYSSLTAKLKADRNKEFISLISYFEIFISNHNNVYKSISLLIPYASDWMKEKLDILLKEIDNDKSVTPFINFSHNFTYLAIQNVLISIYQMIDQGEDNTSLYQFDYLFSSMANNMYKEKIEAKSRKLESLSSLSLLGSGLITITLTLSIMSLLGDLTNVI